VLGGVGGWVVVLGLGGWGGWGGGGMVGWWAGFQGPRVLRAVGRRPPDAFRDPHTVYVPEQSRERDLSGNTTW
jgi:hypothetical protein